MQTCDCYKVRPAHGDAGQKVTMQVAAKENELLTVNTNCHRPHQDQGKRREKGTKFPGKSLSPDPVKSCRSKDEISQWTRGDFPGKVSPTEKERTNFLPDHVKDETGLACSISLICKDRNFSRPRKRWLGQLYVLPTCNARLANICALCPAHFSLHARAFLFPFLGIFQEWSSSNCRDTDLVGILGG